MSVSTTGYDFLMAVADQCNHRDIKAFIIEQFKSTFDQDDVNEILDESERRPDGIDIYRLTQELETQIEGLKKVQTLQTTFALTDIMTEIKKLQDSIGSLQLQNHGALPKEPIHYSCPSHSCPMKLSYYSTVTCDNITTSTSSNDGS